MASSVLAERSVSGVPRHTAADSTVTIAMSRVNAGSANGSISRAAAKDAVMATPATSAIPRSTGRPACSNSRVSSQSPAALAITTSVLNIQPGAFTTMTRNTGSSTSALARRFSTRDLGGTSSATAAAMATSHPTEASIATLIVHDRPIEIGCAEVRPQRRGDPQLRVSDLPQQEVRDPHLPAGADQQIRIRHAVGVERATDVGLRERVRRELARLHAARENTE